MFIPFKPFLPLYFSLIIIVISVSTVSVQKIHIQTFKQSSSDMAYFNNTQQTQNIPGCFDETSSRQFDERNRKSIDETLQQTRENNQKLEDETRQEVHNINASVFHQGIETMKIMNEREQETRNRLKDIGQIGHNERKAIKIEAEIRANEMSQEEEIHRQKLEVERRIETEKLEGQRLKFIALTKEEEEQRRQDTERYMQSKLERQKQMNEMAYYETQKEIERIKEQEEEQNQQHLEILGKQEVEYVDFLQKQRSDLEIFKQQERYKQQKIREAEENKRKKKKKQKWIPNLSALNPLQYLRLTKTDSKVPEPEPEPVPVPECKEPEPIPKPKIFQPGPGPFPNNSNPGLPFSYTTKLNTNSRVIQDISELD